MLGSQNEAEEIFEFHTSYNEWLKFHQKMEWAAAYAARWDEQYENFKRDGVYGYDPGAYRQRYAFGPELPEPKMPTGWVRKGAGCARTAYLSPTGVIYKVNKELDTGDGVWQDSAEEHRAAERIRSKPPIPGAYIPETALYRVDGQNVIAMEFMDGEFNSRDWRNCTVYGNPQCRCGAKAGYCSTTIQTRMESVWGLTDLHGENVVWLPRQRKWAVVDMGLSSMSRESVSGVRSWANA